MQKHFSAVAHFTCERVFLKGAASKNKRTLTTADVDILLVLRQPQIQRLPNISCQYHINVKDQHFRYGNQNPTSDNRHNVNFHTMLNSNIIRR